MAGSKRNTRVASEEVQAARNVGELLVVYHCLAPESISLASNTGQERNEQWRTDNYSPSEKFHIVDTYDKTFTYLKSCHKLNRAH